MTEQLRVISLGGEYPIFVGAGLLNLTPIPQGERGEACAIITNARVGELYASRVAASLRAQNLQPQVIEIPDGEEYKTLDTVRAVYDRLIDAQMDRRSIIFALGGGVIGDLAGFVAATFLRGVPFAQIPTTLLAMVDASIGGKVAVDHPRGKNLIGAFKQPMCVIADTDTLTTLPDAEWRAGMAEVVKHGIIADAGLFEELESESGLDPSTLLRASVGSWLARAMRVKVDIVSRDPFEQGERAKLNLGHTFAHAFEKLSDYTLRHGDAVAIGLVCTARLATRLKIGDPGLVDRIKALLGRIELPTRVPREMSAAAIFDAMQTDKKRVGARLRFVLPRTLGDVVIVDTVTGEDVMMVIEETKG